MDVSLKDNESLIKKVLAEQYIAVVIDSIIIEDSTVEDNCRVSVKTRSGETIPCLGTGMVDAIFSGLVQHFSLEFTSLEGIHLQKFVAKATSSSLLSEVNIEAEIKNSYGNTIYFEKKSRSLISAATEICSSIIEYFINSDKAYSVLSNALVEARTRNRIDLIERYTAELAILVKSTKYSN